MIYTQFKIILSNSIFHFLELDKKVANTKINTFNLYGTFEE